jgi:4-hydroxythreonine-4-phosphate dehydrogenase
MWNGRISWRVPGDTAGVKNAATVRLAITLGDPRGIGAEVVAKAVGALRPERIEFVVVGPTGARAGARLHVHEPIGEWAGPDDAALAGRLAGAAIERAVDLAMAAAVDGIVTAPIDKHALLLGGFDYPGHTEMLATLTGRATGMMLASAGPTAGGHPLRVVLATTHIPLRDVPDSVTRDAIVNIANITRQGLREWFGIDARIALCALNPHAGDSGRFGDEDSRVLAPAAAGAGISGPFPADTVFVRAMRGEFDAVIAPYHDVGMTAIKVAAFGDAVNVTLGLPFPRTSPDHGTALDIAGEGVADASSMSAAIEMCAAMARRRRGL